MHIVEKMKNLTVKELPQNRYIHYGSNSFQKNRFVPIESRDFSNKPKGGLWACACHAKNAWSKWCKVTWPFFLNNF